MLKRVDGGGQWSFRYSLHGRAREMGLGSAAVLTLADARRLAAKWRGVVGDGKDPQKERAREASEAAAVHPTLAEIVSETFEARKAQLKKDGDAGRWMSPLRVHVLPALGRMPVTDLDQTDLKSVLGPIWHSKPEAARKALNRVGIVLRHAAAMGLDVDLQAMEKAKSLLGAQRRERRNIPSMPWQEVPAFFASLDGGTTSELALKLVILTACRSGEVRGLLLDEIKGDTWLIPAQRMKAGREHRVPLSDAALEVIEHARPLARGGLLFPGRGQGPISDMTMTALMKRRGLEARPHGFRSNFRVWCAEATDTPREIAEAALAHSIAGKVEAAYQRSDHLERRRNLMARWADHVLGRSGALVSLVDRRL